LGECGNESLGMNINRIKITSLKNNITVAGKYTATGTADKEYKNGLDLYAKSHSITSKVISKEAKIDLRHNLSKSNKPKANVTS